MTTNTPGLSPKMESSESTPLRRLVELLVSIRRPAHRVIVRAARRINA